MLGIRKIIALFCICALTVGCSVPARAQGNERNKITQTFEDGSYIVTILDHVEHVAIAQESRANTVEGTKTSRYYNSSNELMWTFSISGTFQYNGTTAKALASDYTYEIYDSTWSFKSAEAHCSQDYAEATGNFKHLLIFSQSVTVTLTCSPHGVLS